MKTSYSVRYELREPDGRLSTATIIYDLPQTFPVPRVGERVEVFHKSTRLDVFGKRVKPTSVEAIVAEVRHHLSTKEGDEHDPGEYSHDVYVILEKEPQ